MYNVQFLNTMIRIKENAWSARTYFRIVQHALALSASCVLEISTFIEEFTTIKGAYTGIVVCMECVQKAHVKMRLLTHAKRLMSIQQMVVCSKHVKYVQK